MIGILDADAVASLKARDIPAWLAGQQSFLSSLFDLMNQADSINRYKLNKVYPLEMKAFKEWQGIEKKR